MSRPSLLTDRTTVLVYTDRSTADALSKVAAARRRSRSGLIRDVLRDWLDVHHPDHGDTTEEATL